MHLFGKMDTTIDEFAVVEPRCEAQRASPSLDTPENRLFGNYFSNIDECRTLMEGTQVLASGSAVLHALQPNTWRPPNLDLFASQFSLGDRGLLYWHTYFLKEGYFLKVKEGHELLPQRSASDLNLLVRTPANENETVFLTKVDL